MTYEIRKLREVFAIKKGRKPELHAAKKPGDVPYLVAKVMRGAQEPEWVRRDDPTAVHVTEDEAIIICDGSNSGEVFSGFSGALSSTMAKIEPKFPIDQTYLRRFLESNAELFAGTKTGTAIPHLDQDAMFNLEIPLPPLPEQKRIVRLLDEAFQGITIAKANAEKNLQNARALFESRLQAVIQTCFDKAETTALENLCASDAPIIYGILQPGPHQPSGIPFVRPTEMQDGVIEAGSLHRTSPEIAKRYKRSTLATGDIILSIVGTIGKVAVVEEWLKGGNITQSSARIRADKTKIKPEYLRYLLLSSQLKNQYESVRMGTAVTRLNIAHVRALRIPVLPMQRQQEVVDELSNVALACQNLSQIMNRKSALIDALGASLLQAYISHNEAAA
jgi:type I restriction enzyme, S subunit